MKSELVMSGDAPSMAAMVPPFDISGSVENYPKHQ